MLYALMIVRKMDFCRCLLFFQEHKT